METTLKHSRKNPIEASNFLSILFFGWIVPIFRKGARRGLHLGDLFDPLKSHESQGLGDRLESEWEKELIKANKEVVMGKDGKKKPVRQPNLMWAITRIFWAPYTVLGLVLFVDAALLQLIRPVLQGWIIRYFDSGQNTTTKNQVLVYAGLLVVVTLISVFLTQHALLRTREMGMCIRIACCSMIYRKVLRLNQAAVRDTTVGQIANLISNDVARFDIIPEFLHYLWIVPIQLLLMGYLMWGFVGVPALVGIGTMILMTIPIQGYMSSLGAKLRAKIAVQTDERMQLMSELLSGIQMVKMYSWEEPFTMMVTKVRALEMKFIAYTSYLKGFDASNYMFASKISVYFILVTFVLMGNALNPEITFVLVGLFIVLQKSCNYNFSRAIIVANETNVSLERITEFLLLDEAGSTEKGNSGENDGLQTAARQPIGHPASIQMTNVTANWIHDQLPPTLRDFSMDIRSRSLCALVGPVGSGKSSVLHLILGELSVQAGRLSLFGEKIDQTIRKSRRDIRISYASQNPWLFSGTLRDNILFDQTYDKTRYHEVTKVCALHEDFRQLPQGDMTFVGEEGAALSGGQKARVNLARAVYRDAEVYLFDDPLSAVDARVSCHLFEECIAGFLKDKTRILVTHQLQYLRQADTVVVLNRGTVECQGTYEELVRANHHFANSKDPDKVESPDENSEAKPEIKTSAVTQDGTGQLEKVTDFDKRSKDVGAEEMATGQISNGVYRDYCLAGGNICSLVFSAAVFVTGQVATSGTDYWVTYWSNQEALRAISQSNMSDGDSATYSNHTEDDHEEMYSMNSQWFDENGLPHRNLGIYVYTVCLIACILFATLRSMLFTRLCMNASRNVHDSMYDKLLKATMRFFNTNPSGRILNRFTQDVGTMDESLPTSIIHTTQVFMQVVGIFMLVTLVNSLMILPIVAVCGLFYVVRSYYLKTAQDIKRLEGITKSPMFSQVSSTLDGLTTIRSRGPLAEKLLRREFDTHQNEHTGAWYLTLATATVFTLALELITCFFIACICFSSILANAGDTLGGFVGLAISQSLLLSIVQYGMRQSTDLVSQMTSVERILQYTKLPQEEAFTTESPPPPTWPSEGGLIFKNVSMRYADHEPLVLKNLNFTIHPGWKVGIVGRTGAGKSSIISALFRLAGNGLEGKIVLDGVDTKSIGLRELRPCISIIPQDPILLSATLRYNLDPFEQYSDAELWSSLREVELGDVVSSLDSRVTGGGANFSMGQRQLICLARAILKKNRLLVLDEATANIDNATDALIQRTIRRRFADCTMLTIAHRLNTIIDSDRVLVMREGSIVEFGHPHLLLKNPDGYFSQMLQRSGNANAEKLALIAESTFQMSPEFGKGLNDTSLPPLTEHIAHS